MNKREKTLFNGHIMYHFATLADKLDQLCQIQVLLNQDILSEAVAKMRDENLACLREDRIETSNG